MFVLYIESGGRYFRNSTVFVIVGDTHFSLAFCRSVVFCFVLFRLGFVVAAFSLLDREPNCPSFDLKGKKLRNGKQSI